MIQAINVTTKFDHFVALNQITCTIPRGCIYGMVGSNGAGKSTFLRLISGVYRPEQGQITVDGQPVYENPPIKARIAYVPDDLFFSHGKALSRGLPCFRLRTVLIFNSVVSAESKGKPKHFFKRNAPPGGHHSGHVCQTGLYLL